MNVVISSTFEQHKLILSVSIRLLTFQLCFNIYRHTYLKINTQNTKGEKVKLSFEFCFLKVQRVKSIAKNFI
jgi:hypothetical protein